MKASQVPIHRILCSLVALCFAVPELARVASAQAVGLTVYPYSCNVPTYQHPPLGAITIEPIHVICNPGTWNAPCVYGIQTGTTNTLIATAPAGNSFAGWFVNNCQSIGGNPTLNLILNANTTVYAYFVTNNAGPYWLTVYKGVAGLNNGTVSGPSGFVCALGDSSASQQFVKGAVVTLTNAPAPNWRFAYWDVNGIIYSNNGPISVTMNGDATVQAIFTYDNQPPTVTITAPTNTASVWVCAPFQVAARASDPDGSITKVEFFLGDTSGTKIGQETFLPSVNGASVTASTWWKTNVLGTNITIVARATDNSGATAVSSPVVVTTALPPLHWLVAYGITSNQCELCLNAQTGHVYRVLATTNLSLTNPAAWSNLGAMITNSTPIGGNVFLKFFDSSVTNLPRRFYKALQQ